jgi:HK97 family phage major capsid protein
MDVTEPRTIEERVERNAEIVARIGELEAEFAGTVMSDEARQEWNELNSEHDAHDTAVKEMRKRRERIQQLSGSAAATERGADTGPAFIKHRGVDVYDVNRIRSESGSEEEYRDKLHDNAKRAIERAHFPSFAGSRERVQEHIEDLLARCDDDRGTLAKRILVTGSPVYDRAFGKAILRGPMALSAEEQRAMSVYGGSPVGEEGGFAVPFQLDPTINLASDGAVSPLRQISRVEQIASKTWQGITSDGITVSRSAEGVESGDSSFTIEQPEVSPTRVIADVRFSIEADQDWAGFRSEVSRLLMDAKDVEEADSFVVGDGTSNAPNGVVATLADASEVSLDVAGTLDLDDLLGLEGELPVRFRSRGRFMGNKSIYQDIRGLGEGSDGADLWVRLSGSQPDELLGYPAHEASAMDELGDVDGRILLFGDFSQFIIVDRLGMTVEVNPHIVGGSGRWTGQRAIVAVWRNSSLVLVDNAFRVLTDPTT